MEFTFQASDFNDFGPISLHKTQGQNPTFYPEITNSLMFEIVNKEILKMWTLWKRKFWKYEFCEKRDFE